LKTIKKNSSLPWKRTQFICVLFVAAIVFSGWSAFHDPFTTGPYKFLYPANFGNRVNEPTTNPTTKQGVHLGRLLFYEKKLSANNQISCGSCHQQKLAFTDGLALSKGVDQVLTTRNSMSLVNLLWTRKFFWDGRAQSLEEQADFPLTNPHEMGQSLVVSAEKLRNEPQYLALFKIVYGDQEITGDRIKKAISQFERTLISSGSLYDKYLAGQYKPTANQLRGITVFKNCEHCHGGVKNYKEVFHNNGLDLDYKDTGIQFITGLAADSGRFKVPTLRNIAVTGPYMHDGRFNTLQEVIDHYSDHVTSSNALSSFIQGRSAISSDRMLHLTQLEKKDLLAFLNMLTDTTFLHNPAFSDPHLKPEKVH
jgi:cytochrome c peroxidase